MMPGISFQGHSQNKMSQMSQIKLKLSILEDLFTIHRFPPDHEIPKQIYESQFYSISKTEDELSIVCSSSVLLDSESSETGWSCIKVMGPLDFFLPDPSDDLVLEVAVAGGCDAIITYNKRHFKNVEKFGLKVLDPKELLTEIGVIS